MEAPEPIETEIIKPSKYFIKIDFNEELEVKKENKEYKVQFGISQNQKEVVVKVLSENLKDLFYYQKFYNIFEIKKLSKAFSQYETAKDIITFLKQFNFEIEEQKGNMILKFNIYMPNGQNELIKLNLPKNPQDKNHIIKYFLEEIKSIKNNMKNSEEKWNQEISRLKEQNEKYQNEIIKLNENNKKELLNLKKERKKLLVSISIILFIIVFIFSYLTNAYKTALNDNIINIRHDILNFKGELYKNSEENKNFHKSLENKFEKLWGKLNKNDHIKEIIEKSEKLNETDELNISFDSKIVSLNSINFIINYIRENDKSFIFDEIKLLYRGSRDGDNTTLCHELCDNKQNVLIIIKSDYGYIFGGYSKIGFKSFNDKKKKQYKKDIYSFLFSIDLNKIYPAIKDRNTINNLSKSHGLCFTGSLFFYDKFMNQSNNTIRDTIQDHFNGLSENYEMNGGIPEFKIVELEVFYLS